MDLKLPELGDGIESGDVLEIFVSVGDTIAKGDGIAELETDKATVTVPADASGKVTKIHISEGDTVNIGAVMVTIEAAEAAPAAKPAAQQPDPAKAATKEQPKAEPAPAQPDPIEPAPADSAQQAPAAPAPNRQPPAQPTPQPTRQPQPAAETQPVPSAPSSSPTNTETIPAGPAIRKFAREVGVNLANVTGSGESGRITRDDILAIVRSSSAGEKKSGAAAPAVHPAGTDSDNWGPVRYEKISKIRRTIAEKMHESWSTCPRVTNFDDADVTDLEEFRQNSKADYAAQGIKLTSMPFIMKAVAMALKKNPTINASIDMNAGQIIYKEYVHIGVAIDSERGLMVPCLRNVDRKSIAEIARELDGLIERVRGNKVTIEELRGGSFSISNLGAIGGTYSTPIINYPETAILLIGRSRKMPVVVGDEIVARLMMPLSLSYDHRLIDGATAARFLNGVIGFLSAPSRILLAP
jgi:pyruvate/2-oxoglutarate dehydrogenase complex dihydrolipoamide acyltransferase (E2) component